MIQQRQPFPKRKSSGFTLIEVMVTVAIIGILAAVAIPAYTDYVIRGQLSSAATALSTMKAQMEQYFQNNRSYGPVGGLNPPCSALTLPSGRTFDNFTVSCPAVPGVGATSYVITAVGKPGSVVADFSYSTTELDVRSTNATRAGYGGACAIKWIMKKGEPCV